MSKIQSPEELLARRIVTFPEEGEMTDEAIKRNVYAVIREAQRQAVEYTLEQAAEKGGVHSQYSYVGGSIFFEINKESILSLKDQILKDLKV